MKKAVYTLSAAILLIAATLKTSAQSEETRQVSGFNGIASAGPFDVHVNINGTESLKISASPAMISEIETVVEGGKLQIKFKHHHEWRDEHDEKVDIYVTAKSLSSLVNSGSGAIKVEGVVNGDNVAVVLSGSGDVSASIKSDKLRAIISGSGSIHLKGSTDEAKVVITGSGEMNGRELKTNSASVSLAGSGNAYFSADKSISARIVGSGNVVYSGNATVTNSKTIGSGSISKAD